MSESFTLYKPCGKKMEVSELSLSYALSLGWTDTPPSKPKATKNVRDSKNTGK